MVLGCGFGGNVEVARHDEGRGCLYIPDRVRKKK